MRAYAAVIQRCPDTGRYISHIPGIVSALSQGDSLDERIEGHATATAR